LLPRRALGPGHQHGAVQVRLAAKLVEQLGAFLAVL